MLLTNFEEGKILLKKSIELSQIYRKTRILDSLLQMNLNGCPAVKKRS